MREPEPYFYWTPRSGGTFVWQVLHRLIVVYETSHSFIETTRPIIINYRDPRDILTSYLRIHFGKFDENKNLIYIPPTKEQIDIKIFRVQLEFKTLNEYKRFYENRKDILYLKYEDYISDINILIDKIENFMMLPKVPLERRAEIKRETSIPVNKSIANKVKRWRTDIKCEFDNYEPVTRIHMHHIYDGQYKGWKNYIPKQYHNYINEELKQEIKNWGYEI